MSDANVIAFPVRATAATPADEFSDWMSWAECELAILGHEVSATDYNWRAAHEKGLSPEVAAEHAVRSLEAS